MSAPRPKPLPLLLCAWLLLAVAVPAAARIGPETLGVLVNANDEHSVVAGEYYLRARGIPARNLVRLEVPAGAASLSREAFAELQAELLRRAPPGIQAWAVMWRKPYRVECMSITSALAFGFDRAWCAEGCEPTRRSPWFDSPLRRPAGTLGMTPAMMVQGSDLLATLALIDRGVAADGTRPAGTAYLVETADKARSVRAALYPQTVRELSPLLRARHIEQDALRHREDVLFYFTGGKAIADVASNRYLPGAIADHLTSFGGRLEDGGQMTVMAWIDAGATGSYGTVVEPCNFPMKFPVPLVAIRHYLAGEPLIEAYWKSVLMPGQGLFVGEPLARPFAGADAE